MTNDKIRRSIKVQLRGVCLNNSVNTGYCYLTLITDKGQKIIDISPTTGAPMYYTGSVITINTDGTYSK